MIDACFIFTKGGLSLWSMELAKVKGNPIERLIKEVLLEERVGENMYALDSYNLKWKLLNDYDIFFVVVFQGILQLAYLDKLLEETAKQFLTNLADFGKGLEIKRVDFDAEFKAVLKKVDMKQLNKKTSMKSWEQSAKGKQTMKIQEEKGVETAIQRRTKREEKEGDSDEEEGDSDGKKSGEGTTSKRLSGPRAFVKKEKGKKGDKTDDGTQSGKVDSRKESRVWDTNKRASKATMESLDHSKNKEGQYGDEPSEAAMNNARNQFLGEDDEDQVDVETESMSSGDDEDTAAPDPAKKTKMGGLFAKLTTGVKNLTGGAILTEEDLAPILSTFRLSLMERNVAADVADKLSESVRQAVVGKKTDKFTSMGSTVKVALQDAMARVLTPKKSIDILRAAMAAKSAGRVYTVVFLGVNGVGKSTNLAKVAYYLKHKGGLDVLICACDTFRAGAVEQLKTHSRCLDVPLFERGYGKDPAEIAKQAIAHARTNQHDVVLVDTAGRMQDNEPLMRALAKLVAVNTPDLVLFVGEALVGNDAIDQVTKFNQSLIDFSHDRNSTRGIDGMLLTKYDTVDDKVGAALSMVYVTGQPIVFVGCGQKYTHLRKLDVKEVCKTLLS